ncbi:MAG: hypothetical protein VX794_01770 [Nitrospinota bacterium]|nr:hypothetical protein [Nitrospinota bacterium]
MNVHPAYEKSLGSMNASLNMEGFLKEQKNLVLLSSSWNGVTLSVLIDPMTHIVKKALHKDGSSSYIRKLMELFCKQIIELPIQEAADHACIIIEDNLRDRSVCVPVPGIVTPENADPIFRYPLKLIREIFKEYCVEKNYKPTINFFDRQFSEGWLSLSSADRLKRVKCLLDKFLLETQSDEQLEVVEIEKDVKLIIRSLNRSDNMDFAQLLINFENVLKKELEESLYVELEEVKDLNSIRRI